MNRFFSRLVQRTAGSVPRQPNLDSPITTEHDIRMCFRLLLGRNPNPEEWAGHSAQAGQDLAQVVAGYTNSLEFARRTPARPDAAPAIAQRDGYRLYASPADIQIGRHVLDGVYEPEIEALFRAIVRPGMAIIDIGANIGVFTMLSAHLAGPTGAVLAIEPNPDNARMIEASRRLNGFDHVTVAQAGAGRALGLLVLNTTHSNGTTSDPGDDLAQLLQSRTVACLPVDTLVSTMWPGRPVALIKVDVEGAEYNALLGAQATIARDHPTIITEFSPTFMPGISGVSGPEYLQWLHAQGYEIAIIDPDGPPIPAGQDPNRVMQAFEARNKDHIDLLATPLR